MHTSPSALRALRLSRRTVFPRFAASADTVLLPHSSNMSTSTATPPQPFFQLTSTSTDPTLPRLGCVLGRLPTPNVLTFTQHGLPPHLTIDNWRHLPDMTAFHVPLASLVSQPSASVLSSSHLSAPASLASYFRYPASSFLLLSMSDPLLPVQQCSDTSVVLASTHGNQRVTPLQLVQRARTLRPDALLLASDCHTGGGEAERGRERKAVWRSLRWFKEQMHTLYGADETTAQASEADNGGENGERKSKRQRRAERQEEATQRKQQQSDSPAGRDKAESRASEAAAAVASLSTARHVKPPYVIAPLPLTSDSALQQQYMADIGAHSHLIDGYSVAVPTANPDAVLSSVLPSVLSQLPAASLRHCSSHPHSLSSLFAVACSGIDLISSALPYNHSLLGLALSLNQPALSLHSPALATSPLPLAADCRCYTCTHHTRAYLHHMLRVKEMTATVLLDLHNTHTVLQLMRLVRERLATQEGSEGWQQWKDEWMHMLEANESVEAKEREQGKQKETAGEKLTATDATSRPQVVAVIS